MDTPSLESKLRYRTLKFIHSRSRVTGYNRCITHDPVRVSLGDFVLSIISLASKLNFDLGIKLLDAWSGETKHLHVYAALIHF
jgi:hypothetical protein